MSSLPDKLATLWPEMSLGLGAVLCLLTGLGRNATLRRATVWVAGLALLAAAALALIYPIDGATLLPGMPRYIKAAVPVVGLLLLLMAARIPEQLSSFRHSSDEEPRFDPATAMRGEFFCFFLLSLAGAMLCASANDLVWLFLALELTSLPTYVMVATTRPRLEAQEAGVKYFFLGALAAAMFLYGFALIYGATGYTDLGQIAHLIALQGETGLTPLLIAGLLLSIVGISFKIAAFPMHFYAADVYQGANVAVTAFLAFVPKTAGFVALMLLLSLVGWPLPQPIAAVLWVTAALTMTLGNVLGLLQNNVKRVLAYSSIAHSGYILVGLLAGPIAADGVQVAPIRQGLGAVLFYLVAYGLATLAAFAVIGSLQTHDRDEAQGFDALSGLARRQPLLAGVFLLSLLSLIGIPPLVGFVGKIYLFGAAVERGYLLLVVIAVINSAISAVYYLRMASACFFGTQEEGIAVERSRGRDLAAAIGAVAALVLGLSGAWLIDATSQAQPRPVSIEPVEQVSPVIQAEPAAKTQPVVAAVAE